jgi:hypothetical protein
MGKAEELYELLREREECIWAISQASRLLNERWISLTTYKEITWRHVGGLLSCLIRSSVKPMSSAEQLGKFRLRREGLLRFKKQNSTA